MGILMYNNGHLVVDHGALMVSNGYWWLITANKWVNMVNSKQWLNELTMVGSGGDGSCWLITA